MSVDKLRLIDEVRKRPLLWNHKNIKAIRSIEECEMLWTEVGGILNINVDTCKICWRKLRSQFCSEANHITRRIAKAKAAGSYNPKKKYYQWFYFDKLRFLADGLSTRAKFDLHFGNDSDSDIEIIEKNTADQTQSQLADSNLIQIDSDNEVEIVESDNLDQAQSRKYFENYYESDNDIEIVENDTSNLVQTECVTRIRVENECSPKANGNTSLIVPTDDLDGSTPEGTNFRSFEVSISSCFVENNALPITLNDNTLVQRDATFKEEPELQIETENDSSEYEDVNQLHSGTSSTLSAAELGDSHKHSDLLAPLENSKPDVLEDFVSIQDGVVNDNSELLEPEKDVTCSPCQEDEDYCFLYSFISQTKQMNQLQKMEFRANMKKLLIQIFPASASVNVLEKQLLLPEDNDPDRKFLINFWPFIKLMSLTQNLQFRVKMAQLVAQILLNEYIL